MTDQNQTPISEEEKAIATYVEGLMKEKNDPHITDANRAQAKDFLIGEVVDAMNKKLISLLPDAKVDELNKLLDRNATDDEIGAFFAKEIPNREEVIAQILADFRTGYLSVVPARGNLEQFVTSTPGVEIDNKNSSAKKDDVLGAPLSDMMEEKKGKMPSPAPTAAPSDKKIIN